MQRAEAITAQEILQELKSFGSDAIKKVLANHGAREPFFGVKVEHLKKLQKRIKTNHELALALYDTGISDAMYLAGLIADDARMTKKDLDRWVNGAYWYMISEYTVPWVTAGSPHGRAMALKWIESKKENVAAAGWATLGSLVATKADEELDLEELKRLIQRVERSIHDQPNRVRYAMNCFLLSVATYVKPLSSFAVATAEKIGIVSVDMGGTSCKVPYVPEYIKKVQARGALGKKRKSAKC